MERKKIHLEYLLNATSKKYSLGSDKVPLLVWRAGLLIGFSQTIKQ